jgi:hypothetical protein
MMRKKPRTMAQALGWPYIKQKVRLQRRLRRLRLQHTGAYGMVAPMTAAAIGEGIFYPAPQRLD